MNYVFWQLKADGVRRTFGHSHAWNKASIHGIEKTYFHRFGQARKYSIFNRIVVIYSDVRAK
jgi:RimJ/RimL family protein N-acetyltransferase